ncbi:MAG: hypothetical protein MUE33_10310 [Cytophagaceae bacterium]|jgi:hypothetical protein|nr:hypothetical protein [Cytophagaceae bacterium]
MRNIEHHALIITCNDLEVMQDLRTTITGLYKIHMEASHGEKLITPIYESLINHYYTMSLIPDGSKEGYDASDDNDAIRSKVIQLLKEKSTSDRYHLSFIEVRYGGDQEKKEVLN